MRLRTFLAFLPLTLLLCTIWCSAWGGRGDTSRPAVVSGDVEMEECCSLCLNDFDDGEQCRACGEWFCDVCSQALRVKVVINGQKSWAHPCPYCYEPINCTSCLKRLGDFPCVCVNVRCKASYCFECLEKRLGVEGGHIKSGVFNCRACGAKNLYHGVLRVENFSLDECCNCGIKFGRMVAKKCTNAGLCRRRWCQSCYQKVLGSQLFMLMPESERVYPVCACGGELKP